MATDPYQTLGLSCPRGGRFYICAGNATEFLGCCASDPCASGAGRCPPRDLAPASFSSDGYAAIPRQDCDDARRARVWWTCRADTPPFLGCCASDPCRPGGCPPDELLAATLSADDEDRLPFVSVSVAAAGTGTGTGAVTTASRASPAPSSSSSSSAYGALSAGAVAGIVVGVVLTTLVVIGWLVYKCGTRRRRRRRRQAPRPSPGIAPAKDPLAGDQVFTQGELSPYRDSYSTAFPSGPNSPFFLKGQQSPIAQGHIFDGRLSGQTCGYSTRTSQDAGLGLAMLPIQELDAMERPQQAYVAVRDDAGIVRHHVPVQQMPDAIAWDRYGRTPSSIERGQERG